MRSHRLGVRTTRRMESDPFSLSNWAMATFAATMKLSIMSSATLCCRSTRSFTSSFSTTGVASMDPKVSAPCCLRNPRNRSEVSSCSRSWASIPGVAATAAGIGPRASNQAPVEL